MTAVTFQGVIINKVFVPNSEEYYRHHLSKFEGKEVRVAVMPKKKVRSLNQNAYYWFCLGLISQSQGNTPEELHKIFKSMFCPRKYIKYKGKEVSMPKSTADMTVSEFMEYFDRVKQEASELGVLLPEADELYNI
jgi:hypothetical protein